MISNREMFCTLFGALTMVDYIPIKNKQEIMNRMASELFNLSKEDLKTILEELDTTMEYIMKQFLVETGKGFDI